MHTQTSMDTHTHAYPKTPEYPVGQMKKIKIPNVSKALHEGPPAAGLICRVYVCVGELYCVCKRERWSCPAATLRPTTTGDRSWIIHHIHYSTGHEYQRERREKERCRRPASHHNKPYLPYHTIC